MPDRFLLKVQEFLLKAGWALFWAGSSYAIIRISSVEGWQRISSKRIEEDLRRIARGHFDFDEFEDLLRRVDETAGEQEEDRD